MRAPAEMRAAERKEWIGLPLTRETLEHKIEAYLALQRAQEPREVAWRRTVLLNRTEVLDFLDFLCFAVTDEPGEWDFLGAAARYSPEELGLSPRLLRALSIGAPAERIRSVAALYQKSDGELLAVRGVGRRGLAEIRQKLSDFFDAWERGELPPPSGMLR